MIHESAVMNPTPHPVMIAMEWIAHRRKPRDLVKGL